MRIIEKDAISSQKSSSASSLKTKQLMASPKINEFIKPTLEPSKAHFDRDKRHDINDVLTNTVIDDETALIEVSFDNDFELAQVIRSISSYNRRNETIIQMFYEPFVRRLEATLRLQRWMKGIMFRRKTKPLFRERSSGGFVMLLPLITGRQVTVSNTLYGHYVLVQRVVRRI